MGSDRRSRLGLDSGTNGTNVSNTENVLQKRKRINAAKSAESSPVQIKPKSNILDDTFDAVNNSLKRDEAPMGTYYPSPTPTIAPVKTEVTTNDSDLPWYKKALNWMNSGVDPEKKKQMDKLINTPNEELFKSEEYKQQVRDTGAISAGFFKGSLAIPEAVRGITNTVSGLLTGNSKVIQEPTAWRTFKNTRQEEMDKKSFVQNIPEQASQTITAMLPAIALGGTAGLVELGIQAGGQNSQQALDEGAAPAKALGYGAITGTAEGLLERAFGFVPGLQGMEGNVLEKLTTGNIRKNLVNYLFNFGKKSLGEGLEEVAMEPISQASKGVLYDDSINFNPLKSETYGDKGIFPFQQMLESGALGTIVGGIMGSAQIPSDILRSKTMMKDMQSNITQDLYVATSLPNTYESNRMAQTMLQAPQFVNYENFAQFVDQMRTDVQAWNELEHRQSQYDAPKPMVASSMEAGKRFTIQNDNGLIRRPQGQQVQQVQQTQQEPQIKATFQQESPLATQDAEDTSSIAPPDQGYKDYQEQIDKIKTSMENAKVINEEIKKEQETLQPEIKTEVAPSIKTTPQNKVIETGKPFESNVFHGKGKTAKEIYNYLEHPIMGLGKYYAFSESDAKNYGDTITSNVVKLNKPFVIRDDVDWRNLTRASGWEYPNPYGGDPAKIRTNIDKLKETVLSKGYDGIVVKYRDDIDGDISNATNNSIKLLNNIFGHDQVVSYNEDAQEEVLKPQETKKEAPTISEPKKTKYPVGTKLKGPSGKIFEVTENDGNNKITVKNGSFSYVLNEEKLDNAYSVVEESKKAEASTTLVDKTDAKGKESSNDDLYNKAKNRILETGNASAAFLQREFKIGYARALDIIDRLEKEGFISSFDGKNPRTILSNKASESKSKQEEPKVTLEENKDPEIQKTLEELKNVFPEKTEVKPEQRPSVGDIITDLDKVDFKVTSVTAAGYTELLNLETGKPLGYRLSPEAISLHFKMKEKFNTEKQAEETPKTELETKVDKLDEKLDNILNVLSDKIKVEDGGNDVSTGNNGVESGTKHNAEVPDLLQGNEGDSTPKETDRESGGYGRDGAKASDRRIEKESTTNVTESKPNTDTGSEPISNDGKGVRRRNSSRGDTGRVGGNFRISENDVLFEGGKKTRFKNNTNAIRVLKKIESENRNATPDEQKELIKYVGWGGIAEAFDKKYDKETGKFIPSREDWIKEYGELIGLLTEQEYESAASSTQNAHYTHPDVINAMYNIAKHLGVKGGNFIEPSSGIGHFVGLMPEEYIKNSKFLAIEKDSITGRIAKQLYPNSDVRVSGYESIDIPDNYFDMAISNVPFGSIPITDSKYKDRYIKERIHNYFFIKSLDKVKEGGLVMFITSTGTLDAYDETATKVRALIQSKADLIAAIRLPGDAFKENAGTEVTTDIIILRKRKQGEIRGNNEFYTRAKADTEVDGHSVWVNEYFVKNPDMVLGEYSVNKLYGSGISVTSTGDTIEKLNNIINKLPKDIINIEASITKDLTTEQEVEELNRVKDNSYFLEKGKVYQKQGNKKVAVDETKKSAKLKSFIEVKEAIKDLISAQKLNISDAKLKSKQDNLHKVYDEFVSKYGTLNSKENSGMVKDDPERYLFYAAETINKETGAVEKADIFNKNLNVGYVKATNVSDPAEALAVVLYEDGYLNLNRISELTGKSIGDTITSLKGYVFKNPSSSWETADEYLSGDVKTKLAEAQEAMKYDNVYKDNIKALENVIPEDVGVAEIDVKLGSYWVPLDVYHSFIDSLLESTSMGITIQYSSITSDYSVNGYFNNFKTQQLSGKKYGFADILEKTLNMEKIVVKYKTDKGTFIDRQDTLVTQNIQSQIQEQFKNWIWNDAARAEKLQQIYNDKLNRTVERKFKANDRSYIGMSDKVSLYDHQKEAVERIVYGGNTLLAHGVGFGKTYIMIAGLMELKRLGIAKKPILVVPNNKLTDFQDDFRKMYPTAKVLAANEDDFKPGNIKTLFARIATNNWDAIIIRHDSLKMIPVSNETMSLHIREQLDELEMAIINSAQDAGKKTQTKKLENQKDNLRAKLSALEAIKRYDVLTFEEMGIDYMFLDEAHEFKNMKTYTSHSSVKGISTTEAQKVSDLYIKTKYISQLHGGKSGLVFATGTPVSNALNEVYTLFKYLRPDILKNAGMSHFDAWLSTFGNISSEQEVKPDGSFKSTERFRNFVNVSELIRLYRQFADIKMGHDSVKLKIPALNNGKATIIECEPHPDQPAFIKNLVGRIDKIPKRPQKGDDNHLNIGTDARKATTDMRLIDADAVDWMGSKINRTVGNIVAKYKETNSYKGTQLVFLQFGRSQNGFDANVDIYRKLIKAGIKADEIDFAHKYKGSAQMETLFEKVNSGKIRVLIGTYSKMGTGFNIQERLAAIHEVDVPYKPSELEQSEGRMIRQGNLHYDMNKPVEIFKYVVTGEKSYDAVMWQILETKIKGMSAVLRGEVRTVDTGEDDAANEASVIKAKAINDPILIESIDVNMKLDSLRAQKNKFNADKVNNNKIMQQLPTKIKALKESIVNHKKDLDMPIMDLKGDNFTAIVNGKKYSDAEKAGEALVKAREVAEMQEAEKVIGKFAGYTIKYYPKSNLVNSYHFRDTVENNEAYGFNFGGLTTNSGIFTRIGNTISKDSISEALRAKERQLKEYEEDLTVRKKNSDSKFEKEKELQKLIERNNFLQRELDKRRDDSIQEVEQDDDGDSDEIENEDDTLGFSSPKNSALYPGSNNQGDKSKTISPTEMVAKIAAKFEDAVIKKGRLGGKRLGQFDPKTFIIKLKKANDIAVLSHEVAHYLDHTNAVINNLSKQDRIALSLIYTASQKKSMTNTTKARESYAEIMRAYMTGLIDNTDSDFQKYIRSGLDPDTLNFLEEIRGNIVNFINLSPVDQVRMTVNAEDDNSLVRKPSFLQSIKSVWKNNIADENSAIIDAAKELGGSAGEQSIKEYLAAHRGFESTASYSINPSGDVTKYQTDVFGNNIGPSLWHIVKPLLDQGRKVEDDFWRVYAVARRAVDYKARGLEMPLTFDVYEAAVKTLENEHPEFVDVFENLLTFKNNLMQMLVDTGAKTQADVDQIKADNPNHMFLFRMGKGDVAKASSKKVGSGVNPISRVKGSGLDIIDPYESLIKMTFVYWNVARKQQSMSELADLADKASGKGKWMSRSDIKIKPVALSSNQVKTVLKKYFKELFYDAGLIQESDVDLRVLESEAAEGVLGSLAQTIFSINHTAGENQVVIHRKGKPTLYDVEPSLYTALAGQEAPITNLLTKILTKVADFQALTIITKITFPIWVGVREFGADMILTRAGITPFDAIKGIINVLGDTPLIHELQKHGGINEMYLMNDRKFTKNTIAEIRASKNAWGRIKHKVRHPLNTWMDAISFLDLGPKVGEARKTLENAGVLKKESLFKTVKIAVESAFRKATSNDKYSQSYIDAAAELYGIPAAEYREAVYNLRDISYDIKRQGSTFKKYSLNRIFRFSRAFVQGLDKLGRSFSDKQVRKNMAIRGTLMVLFSMLLYALNRDNEEYQEMNDVVKDGFWHIPLGDPKTTKYYLPIPKPFEVGLMFSTVPERVLRAIESDSRISKHAFDGFLNTLMRTFMFDITPTPLNPIFDVKMNKNFAGIPIENQGDKGRLPKDRFDARTSVLAKFLGENLGYSPKMIDHLITGYSNSWGQTVLTAMDAVAGEKEYKNLFTTSGVTRFVTDASKSSKSVSELYDNFGNRSERISSGNFNQKVLEPEVLNIIKEVTGGRTLTQDDRAVLADYIKAKDPTDVEMQKIYNNKDGVLDQMNNYSAMAKTIEKSNDADKALKLAAIQDLKNKLARKINRVEDQIRK